MKDMTEIQIRFTSEYIFLCWVFMLLYACHWDWCWNFIHVMLCQKCLINHFFSSLSGYIRYCWCCPHVIRLCTNTMEILIWEYDCFQERYFVGRGMYEKLSDYCRCVIISWIVRFIWSVLMQWSYFFWFAAWWFQDVVA